MGCRSSSHPDLPTQPTVLLEKDPWSLTSLEPDPQNPPYLTNGLIGVRIQPDGISLVPKASFVGSTIASNRDENCVTVFEPPTSRKLPAATKVTPGPGYRQTLHLRTGTLETQFEGQTHSLGLYPNSRDISIDVVDPKPGDRRAIGPAERKLKEDLDHYWTEFWKTDIEIDGPIEDQQAVRSFLYYLRLSIHPTTNLAISPYGLSSPQYKGHVFWDADAWVFPALALIDPARAARIPAYRLGQQTRYEANAKGHGLRVPWESAITGKEVSPPVSSPEIHVTGSVCFGLDMAAALGLAAPVRVADFCTKADAFYRSLATPTADATLELRNVGSVDESHTVDNDLYTNLLAQWLANGRTWSNRSVRYRIARDARSLTTYSGDEDRSHKQAAAILAVFPLQYPEAEKQAVDLVNRYAPITIRQGPAMTDSITALILARAGKNEEAYEKWEHSWGDFAKTPFLLFSEHRATHETYFLTGAAGCLQTVVYGFLGFRIDSQQDAHAAWSTPLKQGKWLNVTPHLPNAWKKVRFKGLHVLGRSYTLTVAPQGVTVVRGD